MLCITSYLVTIAIGCRQTLPSNWKPLVLIINDLEWSRLFLACFHNHVINWAFSSGLFPQCSCRHGKIVFSDSIKWHYCCFYQSLHDLDTSSSKFRVWICVLKNQFKGYPLHHIWKKPVQLDYFIHKYIHNLLKK